MGRQSSGNAHPLSAPASKETAWPAALYVVGTPLGNLAELSPRAIEALREADWVACESPALTGRLLQNLDLSKRLVRYHEPNEKAVAPQIANAVAQGERVALVTDAGMPGISDPGFRAVRACRVEGLPVVPISGPAAFTVALAASGLPSDALLFVGFLPPKAAARKRFFTEHAAAPYTLALYESIHRLEKCLNDIVETLGDERVICVARELTKRHESIQTGPAAEVRTRVLQEARKGEIVILVAKAGYTLA